MRRGSRTRWLGAVALLATLLALGACGRPLEAAGEPAADRGFPAATPTGPGLTTVASSPVLTPDQAAAATPPSPLATPDLSELERLLDRLTEALANDATAPTDEGSPR